MYQLKLTSTLLFCYLITGVSQGYSAPACVAQKTCVPVTIKNNTGKPIYVLIHGSSTNMYFNFAKNVFSADFLPGASVAPVKNQTNKLIYLPGNGITGGGRMYFSTRQMTGIPDLATYPFVYDKLELGWTNGSTAIWNTTAVDFFGIPIQLVQGKTKVGIKDGSTRTAIINDLRAAMKKESALYGPRFFFQPNSTLLRVFSPQHFYTNLPNKWEPMITAGLDSLVADNETNGTGVYFNFNYGGTKYTSPKKLSANSIAINANGQRTVITGITTGNAASGQIQPVGNQFAGLLAATINRGVLRNPKQWGQNGIPNKGFPQYYYQGPVGHYRYNTYAKVLISHAIDSKIYATSYDDYWHMDSSISVGPADNRPVIVNLLPFR